MGLLPVSRIVRGVLTNALAAVALTVVGTSLSCGQDLVTVNERIFVKAGDTWQYSGGGCMTAPLGGSSARAPRPVQASDFEVTEGEDASNFVVQVFSDGDLLASRHYNEATLRSGAVDEFTVTTHAGSRYMLRYWGGVCASLDADIDPDSGK
jgi:hypothetical protein